MQNDAKFNQQHKKISRRDFLGSAVAAYGIAGAQGLTARTVESAQTMKKRSYTDRIAFGCWINDIRTEPLSLEEWPSTIIDEITMKSVINHFDVLAESGYNTVDIFGLFAGLGWPVDIVSAVDKDRDGKVRKIIAEAHQRNLKLLYGFGIYSWGFDAIIQHDAAIRGPNKHAMCASKEESWQWQKKVIDFVLQYDFDGFHLESADLGRCTCEECKKRWPIDAAYHNYITSRTAEYIRNLLPKAYLSVILLNWSKWGNDFSDEDKNQLVALSKNVNCLFDQGHRQPYIPKEKRKSFIERLQCNYGTSGGNWAYAPQRWERLRWFLPYTTRTGNHIKELYEDGGRGIMFYQGPLNNPGVEVNVIFGGRIMTDVDKSVDDVLSEILESLYKPKTPLAFKRLVQVFKRAEDAYFEQWDTQRILTATKMPPPGEMYFDNLMGTSPGPVKYLLEPFLTTEGRVAYKQGMVTCLKEIQEIENEFNDNGRIDKIKTCLNNVLLDINTIAFVKNEKQVWDDRIFK